MNRATKPKLPPNPYRRSPIKKLEDLAGRARERKTIRYYLSLTASGGNPHLALIGQRGVGKTSLLNGAESIAKDLKLLPVRLDMNELKAKSPGRFWHDLYQTLALSMAKAGCWGGVQGTIYAELLRMIYARQPGSLEKAVMQIPYVFSCHQGSIDSFECPDALVVNDFEACLTELQSKGFTGIALLIDEADCLGKNVPLLQMFRNIFQVVEHCSLLLAGTEAVFPALSEVFSPIPRQFHRIDIKPFARWSDTMELVLHPIPKDMFDAVAPKPDVVRELHELCGGAPDEVQLYCHHMYRSVEDGSSARMALSPQVFREVLREYRSNTPANVDAVLNAIERLPDKLLYESRWLSRRTLTLEENIRVTLLRRDLKLNKSLSVAERSEVAKELTEGYRKLFEAGIIEINNCIPGCMEMFERILADKEDAFVRNNLAFCQILTGDVAEGLANVTKALEEYYEPLLELNRGIAEFLQGSVDAAKKSLRNALQQLRDSEKEFDASASYVLVLEPGEKKVSSHGGLPLDAAILLNLWRMGDLTRNELETELARLYPEKAQAWLATFATP